MRLCWFASLRMCSQSPSIWYLHSVLWVIWSGIVLHSLASLIMLCVRLAFWVIYSATAIEELFWLICEPMITTWFHVANFKKLINETWIYTRSLSVYSSFHDSACVCCQQLKFLLTFQVVDEFTQIFPAENHFFLIILTPHECTISTDECFLGSLCSIVILFLLSCFICCFCHI